MFVVRRVLSVASCVWFVVCSLLCALCVVVYLWSLEFEACVLSLCVVR